MEGATGRKCKKALGNSTLLIVLCWIVYTCSYLGKLGYNANIAQIEEVYAISHSTAGMVSTFFFFAYGVGQIINGVFCKKYNIRFVVFGSLLVSAFMNLLVGMSKNFIFIKYYWLVNGAVLSVLWPLLVRLLSETLDKKDIARAVVVMGTTVATGTFFTYGLSSLFVAWASYVVMFIVAGGLVSTIALVWFFAYPNLVGQKDAPVENNVPIVMKKEKGTNIFCFSIGVLAFFAIVVNLVKDGLTTWVPLILKETYALPDYLSILLTMVLPILAIFGTSVAVTLHKKVKDFVLLSAILFFMSAILIGFVIVCLPTGWVIVTLGSFGIISCLMAGVNNIITSMAPLYWKDRINSGLLAGVLNGFCYLGSTLSSYVLGTLADLRGWTAVFWLLFVLCIVAIIVACCYILSKWCERKQREK